MTIPPATRMQRRARFFSGTVVAVLGLAFSLPASSALVSITIDEFGTSVTDPTFVTATGPSHFAEVDLQNGTLKARVIASAPATASGFDGRSLVTEIGQVILTNTSGSPIVASSGFLSLSLDGTFAFGMGTTGNRQSAVYADASLEAVRSPAGGGFPQISDIYSAGISVANFFSMTPGQVPGFHSDPSQLTQVNGATVTVLQNDVAGLRADLTMPGITLNPNDTLTISLRMFTGANATNGTSSQNDFSNTARLALVLPPGAVVSSNAGVPLNWVTAVPLPPAIWLFGTGFLGITRMTRRRIRQQAAAPGSAAAAADGLQSGVAVMTNRPRVQPTALSAGCYVRSLRVASIHSKA